MLTKSISRLLIGVLLFAQFAVASYACPGLMGAVGMAGMTSTANEVTEPTASDIAASDDTASGCEQMDSSVANLCAAHCQQGQQSADTAVVPVLGVGIPTVHCLFPLEPQRLGGLGFARPALDCTLDAAPEPPHAILHCVFRL